MGFEPSPPPLPTDRSRARPDQLRKPHKYRCGQPAHAHHETTDQPKAVQAKCAANPRPLRADTQRTPPGRLRYPVASSRRSPTPRHSPRQLPPLPGPQALQEETRPQPPLSPAPTAARPAPPSGHPHLRGPPAARDTHTSGRSECPCPSPGLVLAPPPHSPPPAASAPPAQLAEQADPARTWQPTASAASAPTGSPTPPILVQQRSNAAPRPLSEPQRPTRPPAQAPLPPEQPPHSTIPPSGLCDS